MTSKITAIVITSVAALALTLWSILSAGATTSTYVFSAVLLVTVGAIIVNTLGNAQPARTMGRLVHDKPVEPQAPRGSL